MTLVYYTAEAYREHVQECVGAELVSVTIQSDVELPDVQYCPFCGEEIRIVNPDASPTSPVGLDR